MIAKIPLRLARSMLPINCTYLKLNIPQSIIETNQLYQLVENDMIFETINLIQQTQNQEVLDQKEFKVQQFEDQQRLELTKTIGNIQILITISYSNREANKYTLENVHSLTQMNYSQDTKLKNFDHQYIKKDSAYFNVYLSNGSGNYTCYECSTKQNDIQIESVSIIDDIDYHKLNNKQEKENYDYETSFINSKQNDETQKTMLNYLSTYGVNQELTQFIENFQADKEQALYVNWLQNQLHFQ